MIKDWPSVCACTLLEGASPLAYSTFTHVKHIVFSLYHEFNFFGMGTQHSIQPISLNTQFNQPSCVSRWCNKCLVRCLKSQKCVLLRSCIIFSQIEQLQWYSEYAYVQDFAPNICLNTYQIKSMCHICEKVAYSLHNKKGLEMSNFLFMSALYAYTHSNYSFTTKEWISTSLWTLNEKLSIAQHKRYIVGLKLKDHNTRQHHDTTHMDLLSKYY